MIGDDAEGDIDLFLGSASILLALPGMLPRSLRVLGQSRFVFLATELFQLVKDWAKNIGLVIRDGTGKVGEIFCALNDRGHALEAHPRIDVPLGMGFERVTAIIQ